MRRALLQSILLAGFCPAGCYSGFQSGEGDEHPGSSGGGVDSDTDNGAEGHEESTGGVPDDDGVDEGLCGSEGTRSLPMRRLTRLEYNNTVEDLFGITSQPALAFVHDSPGGGFHANDLAVSELQARLYVDVAQTVAEEIVVSNSVLPACDLQENPCAEDFVTAWGRRIFRRDLTSDETAEYVAYFEDVRDERGVEDALEDTLAAWLASPPLARR